MSDPKLRALALFDRYVGLSRSRQRQALEKLRESDLATYHALASLLDADRMQQGLLDTTAAALLKPPRESADARVGHRLGAWVIARLISSGGMGTVYEAHRADGQYQQRVALKCIRRELDSPTLAAAFVRERSALAQLEHPNIASLLDGGVEADGRPWFAMRYVEGVSIDQFCDDAALDIHARIALLLQACNALAYAHRNGVLHHDIKPSNLLVTPEGQVQLLDFGLCSAMSASAPEPAPEAGSGGALLAASPGYTAPERLTGKLASVSGDVYSLGVVMYQSLCGDWPLPSTFPSAAPAQPRPMDELAAHATVRTAQTRGLRNARALARSLAGDLTAIALRCVDNDPRQRYPDMQAFGDDLRRWQRGYPVSARRGGRVYRLARFLSRNRLPSALAGGVVLVLVSSLAFIGWQWRQAAREAEATRTVGRMFESTLGAATLSGLSEAPISSQVLLQKTERQLREQRALEDHPVLLARSLATLARSHAMSGDYPQAMRLAREASALAGDDPVLRAETEATLASLLNLQTSYREAFRIASAGLTALQRARGATADEAGLARIHLQAEQARAQWGLSNYGDAMVLLDTAMAAAKRRGPESSESLAELLILRGQWRVLPWTPEYRLEPAINDLQEAISLTETSNPLLADSARLPLVRAFNEMDRIEEGRSHAVLLVENRRHRLGDHHPETGKAWVALAENQWWLGQFADAEKSLRRGEAILESVFPPLHPERIEVLKIRGRMDMTVRWVGATRHDASTVISLDAVRKMVAAFDKSEGPESNLAINGRYWVALLLTYPLPREQRWQVAHDQLEEARALYELNLGIMRRKQAPAMLQKVHYARALARMTQLTGYADDIRLAQQVLKEAIPETIRYLGPEHRLLIHARQTQAMLLYQSGQFDEADRLLDGVIRDARAAVPRPTANGVLIEAQELRGLVAARRNQHELAREYWQQALRDADQMGLTGHPVVLALATTLSQYDRTQRVPDIRF
ncbi:serine/threonine-protein kinase [Lysobacter niastensis]|uniref:Protein kinase n=1 Tax=Lysobacter niastensis TaxID=380629 RepID=A0ABS0BBE9_9GAMM|nr:serine/threonine-protein kinase [Lysobacter niastensis]MBF6025002.1 protein kinase [Lysobacter niastensis]